MAQGTRLTRLDMMLRTLSFAGLPFDLLGLRDRRLANSFVRKGFARIAPSRVWNMETVQLTAAGRRLRRHVAAKAPKRKRPDADVCDRDDVEEDMIEWEIPRTRLEMLLRTLGHLEYPFESLDGSDQYLAVSLSRKGFARIGPSRVLGVDTCQLTAAGWRLRSHVIYRTWRHRRRLRHTTVRQAALADTEQDVLRAVGKRRS